MVEDGSVEAEGTVVDAVEDGSVDAEGTVDAGRQEGPDEFFAEIPGAARAGVKS